MIMEPTVVSLDTDGEMAIPSAGDLAQLLNDWITADEYLEKRGQPSIQDGLFVSMKERIEMLVENES